MAESEIPTCDGFDCVFFDAPDRTAVWGPQIRKCSDPSIGSWMFRNYCAEHLIAVHESPLHAAFVALTAADVAVKEAEFLVRDEVADNAADDPYDYEGEPVLLDRMCTERNCLRETLRLLSVAIQGFERNRMEVARESKSDRWICRRTIGDGWAVRWSDRPRDAAE